MSTFCAHNSIFGEFSMTMTSEPPPDPGTNGSPKADVPNDKPSICLFANDGEQPVASAVKREAPSPVVIADSPVKKQHKGGQTEVTEYYERRLQPSVYLKNPADQQHAFDLLSENPVEVSYATVAMGLWTLVFVDDFSVSRESPRAKPLYDALGISRDDTKQRTLADIEFTKKVKIFSVLPRRKSEDQDVPIWRPQTSRNGRMVKEGIFVTSLKKNSSAEKETLVKTIVDVSEIASTT